MVAERGSRNLLHINFDNGVYESTGGQRLSTRPVPFAAIGRALGYTHTAQVNTYTKLRDALGRFHGRGLALIVVDTSPSAATTSRRRAAASVSAPEAFVRFSIEANRLNGKSDSSSEVSGPGDAETPEC